MQKSSVFRLLWALITVTVTAQDPGISPEREQAVINILRKYTDMGIPGLAITTYSPDSGFWSHQEGYANVEKEIALQEDHVHYLQSVSKTYMAVAVMQLYEGGEIGLDQPIVTYLDAPWLTSIDGVGDVTVRMLLNHTSGLPEYNSDPAIVSRIIQDPLRVFTVPQLLECIADKPLEFEPGTRYRYRNTNYALLSLIVDAITGDNVAYINREVIEKLRLQSTFYLTEDNYKDDMNLTDSYWDVLSESLPANISKLQKANVASMKGDDGLVASSRDAVLFMEGLVTGKLIRPETFKMMQEWVKDEKGNRRYGLGLTYYDLDITYAIGHSGGGIGAGCVLMYLPELNSIVFIATNFNTMIESPLLKQAENLQMEILLALFGAS